MNLKVYILPPLNLIFSQAMLKIVVYQMLIVTNVPVNSAAYSSIYNVLLCYYFLWILDLRNFIALVSNRNTLYKVMGVKTHLSVSVELR